MAANRPRPPYALRVLGALALLGVGALHVDQYFAVHYEVVPVIGTLFVLNLAGAAALAVLLVLPTERLAGRILGVGETATVALLALAGIGLAATSGIFLLVSEHTQLFGFMEHGYRTAIVLSFAAEAAAIGFLGAYLAMLIRVPNAPGHRVAR